MTVYSCENSNGSFYVPKDRSASPLLSDAPRTFPWPKSQFSFYSMASILVERYLLVINFYQLPITKYAENKMWIFVKEYPNPN